MFGIGLPELIVILGIALIVVGPEKLPELARSLGKQMIQLKKAAQDIKDSLNEEMEEDLRQQPEEDIVKLPADFEEVEVESRRDEGDTDEAATAEASTETVASSESKTAGESEADRTTDAHSS